MSGRPVRRLAVAGVTCLALVSELALPVAQAAHEATNALAHSASPYLRLHANDPVHWQEWSPEFTARAEADGQADLRPPWATSPVTGAT